MTSPLNGRIEPSSSGPPYLMPSTGELCSYPMRSQLIPEKSAFPTHSVPFASSRSKPFSPEPIMVKDVGGGTS